MNLDRKKFTDTYKGTDSFARQENIYYSMFLALLEDEELLKDIRFANDVLHIPPLKTFILYERNYMNKDVFKDKMSTTDKRGLGACFGYLFKFIYGGYESEPCWFNDEPTGIKTASYFYKI